MSDDVDALIAEARKRVKNADIEAAFLIMTKLCDALEAAQSAPLVVESREALATELNRIYWMLEAGNDEDWVAGYNVGDYAVAEELTRSGTVRLAADVVREAEAEFVTQLQDIADALDEFSDADEAIAYLNDLAKEYHAEGESQ